MRMAAALLATRGYRDRNHISECCGVQSRDLRSFGGHMLAEACRRPRIGCVASAQIQAQFGLELVETSI
jgi:hypothetical protein